MKRPLVIQSEYEQIGTIRELSSVFESIASMHLAKIRNKAMSSEGFFNELWQVYAQLRVDPQSLTQKQTQHSRPAVIAVTSDSGLIGDIDNRIIEAMLAHENIGSCDVYMIGSHGGALLSQRKFRPTKVVKLPDIERGESLSHIAEVVSKYGKATVYYQAYVSLARQDVSRLDLFSAVKALGEEKDAEIISTEDYLFEPSIEKLTQYLQSMMVSLALGQVILESTLAQHASRFNAMNAAKTRAGDMQKELGMMLSRSRRSAADERTKEILSTLKLSGRR